MFEEQLSRLTDDQLNALRRESELGELNFSAVVERFKAIRTVTQALDNENPDDLPATLVDQVREQLGQVDTLIGQMRDFSLSVDNAASQQNSIVSRADELRNWFAANVRPQVRGAAIDSAARTSLAETQQAASEAQQILSRLRAQAGEAGAIELSRYYGNQAHKHASEAKRFLIATAVGVIVTVMLGLYLFVWKSIPIAGKADTRWEEFLRAIIVRLFFLGIVAWVLAFVSRNYRIAKHLEVTDRQKENALNTYVLFSEAAPTTETQSIITAEIVRAVFGISDSGFLAAVGSRPLGQRERHVHDGRDVLLAS